MEIKKQFHFVSEKEKFLSDRNERLNFRFEYAFESSSHEHRGSTHVRYTFFHKQPVYKQQALWSKTVKQILLDHIARSNNKKSFKGNFCRIANRKSVIIFSPFYFVFLEISINFLNVKILIIYWRGLTLKTLKNHKIVVSIFYFYWTFYILFIVFSEFTKQLLNNLNQNISLFDVQKVRFY